MFGEEAAKKAGVLNVQILLALDEVRRLLADGRYRKAAEKLEEMAQWARTLAKEAP